MAIRRHATTPKAAQRRRNATFWTKKRVVSRTVTLRSCTNSVENPTRVITARAGVHNKVQDRSIAQGRNRVWGRNKARDHNKARSMALECTVLTLTPEQESVGKIRDRRAHRALKDRKVPANITGIPRASKEVDLEAQPAVEVNKEDSAIVKTIGLGYIAINLVAPEASQAALAAV